MHCGVDLSDFLYTVHLLDHIAWARVRLACIRLEANFADVFIFCSLWHINAICVQRGEILPRRNAGHLILFCSVKACKVRRSTFVFRKIGGDGGLPSIIFTIFWMNNTWR